MYLLTYMIFVFFCVYFLFVFPKISSEFQHFYFLRNVKYLSTISEKFIFGKLVFSRNINKRIFFRTSLKLLKENFKENFRTIIYLPTTKCIVFYSGNGSIHRIFSEVIFTISFSLNTKVNMFANCPVWQKNCFIQSQIEMLIKKEIMSQCVWCQ